MCSVGPDGACAPRQPPPWNSPPDHSLVDGGQPCGWVAAEEAATASALEGLAAASLRSFPHLVDRLHSFQRRGVGFLLRQCRCSAEDALPIVKVTLPTIAEVAQQRWGSAGESASPTVAVDPSERYRGAILAHSMGLGKTAQLVTFLVAAAVSLKMATLRVLVVVPLSLVHQWREALDTWWPSDGGTTEAPRLETCFCKSGASFASRAAMIREFWDAERAVGATVCTVRLLLLTPHQYAAHYATENLSRTLDVVVVDEAHMIQRRSTNLSAALLAVHPGAVRVCSTGHPLQNSAAELYAILSVCLGLDDYAPPEPRSTFQDWGGPPAQRVAHTLHRHREEFERRFGRGSLDIVSAPTARPASSDEADAHAFNAIAGAFMHRISGAQLISMLAATGVHLVQWTLFVKPTAAQRTAAAPSDVSHVQLLSGAGDERQRPARPVSLLEQVTAVQLRYNEPSGDNPKFAMLVALLRSFRQCHGGGEKVIVFSQFARTVRALADSLIALGVVGSAQEVAVLCGGDDAAARKTALSRFVEEFGAWVLIATTRVGGLGLNLECASHVVLFDVAWNPAHEVQAAHRVFRIGQRAARVFVYRVVLAATVEQSLLDVQARKRRLFRAVVDGECESEEDSQDMGDLRCAVENRGRSIDPHARDAVAVSVVPSLELSDSGRGACAAPHPEGFGLLELEHVGDAALKVAVTAFLRQMPGAFIAASPQGPITVAVDGVHAEVSAADAAVGERQLMTRPRVEDLNAELFRWVEARLSARDSSDESFVSASGGEDEDDDDASIFAAVGITPATVLGTSSRSTGSGPPRRAHRDALFAAAALLRSLRDHRRNRGAERSTARGVEEEPAAKSARPDPLTEALLAISE